jgi:hypothetical protein
MSLKRVANRRDDALARVGWQALEGLLARYYAAQGYAVEHVGTGGTGVRYDGGIDLKLRRADEYVLVQVKHWNACQVPHNDVHQLLGLMVNEGATGAILVSSGEFTQAATDAANRQGHVRLIDGNELRTMLGADALDAAQAGPDRVDGFADAINAPSRARPRAHIRPRGRASPSRAGGWLAFAAIALLVFGLLMWAVLKKTEGTAGPSEPVEGAAIAIDQADAGTPNVPMPARNIERAPQASDPCKEVIDHFSGTYIDHCAAKVRPTPPTPAEVRALQRRADEAAKLLEASTPEM